MRHLGALLGRLGELLGAQEGAKNGPEIDRNFMNEKKAFGYRLGSILDPFRGVLGPSWGAPGGQNVWFHIVKRGTFEETRFGAQTSSKTLLGANLSPLGRPRDPKGPPKGRPRGAQEAPKTTPKRHQNFDRFFARFWTISGTQRGQYQRGPAAPGARGPALGKPSPPGIWEIL